MNAKHKKSARFLASCIAALTLPHLANAETALYAAAPPDDAAFVRWLDKPATDQAFGFTFAGVSGTDFRFFPATGAEGAAPGGFYSFVAAADGSPALIEEPGRSDPTKVHIVFVNATATPARLVVADKGAVVIDATDVNAAGVRGVNPVTATLAVESADGAQEHGRVEVSLRRGQNITLVARESGVDIVKDGFGAGPDAR